MEDVIRELQRRLEADPEDREALRRLDEFRSRVFGDKPVVEPNKRSGHQNNGWLLFYVKSFVPSHYFPGTMRAHVRFEAGREPAYMKPGRCFSFDDSSGEVRWTGGEYDSILFEWTESIVNEPLRSNPQGLMSLSPFDDDLPTTDEP